ncbi:hypothetical protein ACQKLP_20850 [Chitinophaga sp. NPDC101104]|uniref:hypothetical protein n=1 Tax=Chitinophaga sp. NPDC101104 TaxID=3390561 RepID=UPI003D01C4D1
MYTYAVMLCVLAMTFFSACKKESDDFVYADKFNKSYKAWLSFKASANDKYSFVVLRERRGTFKEDIQTTITVDSGKVKKRAYVRTKIAQAGNEVVEEWSEEGRDLGTHGSGFPLPVMNMDQFYAHVRTVILKYNPDHEYQFTAENNGIISSASVQSKTVRCTDDCISGYFVKNITKL